MVGDYLDGRFPQSQAIKRRIDWVDTCLRVITGREEAEGLTPAQIRSRNTLNSLRESLVVRFSEAVHSEALDASGEWVLGIEPGVMGKRNGKVRKSTGVKRG